VATGLKDVGKNTPVAEVIRRVLESKGKPVTLEELTVSVLDSAGRDFPSTPYDDISLVYKLAVGVLNCQVSFDEVGGVVPVVERLEEEGEPIPLHPRMDCEALNRISEEIRHVKVCLPHAATSPAPAEEKPRKKK
jgi:hypothetical protein